MERRNKVNEWKANFMIQLEKLVSFWKNQLSFLCSDKFDKNTIKLLDNLLLKHKNTWLIEELIRWIKETGNINYIYKWSWLLHIITKYGYNDMDNYVSLLSVPWIDPNISDNLWITPLMIACYNWTDDRIKALLKHPNIDINKQQLSTWQSAVFKSLSNRNFEAIRTLYRDDRLSYNVKNNDWLTFHQQLSSRIEDKTRNKKDPFLEEYKKILVSINWIMRHKSKF